MNVLSRKFAGITSTLDRLFNLIETNMNPEHPLATMLFQYCDSLQSMLSGLVVQVDTNSTDGEASFCARNPGISMFPNR